jgi:predicted PurR-regulated permease PerM
MANRRRKKNSDATESPQVQPSNLPQNKPAAEDPLRKLKPVAKEASPLPLASLELPPLSRILSVVMLILGIVAVGVLFFQVMVGFFVPIFLAALLTVIFRPVHAWLLVKTRRKAVSAALTTALVLLLVLMPVIGVISVAASQFTSMVSQVNFDDLSASLDRARDKFGLSLNDPEKFRRLDQIADSLDSADSNATENGDRRLRSMIGEARDLIQELDTPQYTIPGEEKGENVEPAPSISREAVLALQLLQEFDAAVEGKGDDSNMEQADGFVSDEDFHRRSVNTSAAIRSWMGSILGGTFRSQIRLLANPSAEDFKGLLNRVRESLQPRFVSLTSRTGTYLVQSMLGLVVLVISVYFFLIDGPKMTRTLMRLSPLDDAYEAQLLEEFDRTSRAVVLASVLSALVQGVLAVIAYYFLGFESLILLFMVTTLMALVPFLGAASVWLPCAGYLAAVEQRIGAAIFLLIFGATVISSIDNVIKMYVLHGRSTLHPLLALLSVLGGVTVFGPIGILVGPMVVVFLQTLLEILAHELRPGASESGLDSTTRSLDESVMPVDGLAKNEVGPSENEDDGPNAGNIAIT